MATSKVLSALLSEQTPLFYINSHILFNAHLLLLRAYRIHYAAQNQ